MEDDFDNIDTAVSCVHIPFLRLRVPLRFQSDEVEKEYLQRHKPAQSRSSVVAVLVVLSGSIMPLSGDLSDVRNAFHGTKSLWSQLVLWSHLAVATLALSVVVFSFFRPGFLTRGRRFCLALLAYFSCQAFNRELSVAHSTHSWPHDENPASCRFGLVAVVISQAFATLCCNSAFAPASRSWAACCSVIVVTFVCSLAAQPSNALAIGTSSYLAFIVLLHSMTVYWLQVESEHSERRAFLLLWESRQDVVRERTKRYKAERHAELVASASNAQKAKALQESDCEDQESRFSSDIFDLLHSVDPTRQELAASCEFISKAITDMGDDEHWLIQAEDLILYPDRLLGLGGYGSVVVGSWKLAPVAVKVPKGRENGDRHPLALELRHLRKLRHPNIVSFLGVCIACDTVDMVLVLEYVRGDNLRDFMAKYDEFATHCTRFRWQVLVDVSAALHFLHSQSPALVHGDLKPNNILIEEHTLNAKLTDFGLARRTVDKDSSPGGTKHWLEPSYRVKPRGQVVRSTVDMWAYGAVAFFVSTGVGPWEGLSIRGSDQIEHFGTSVFHLWQGVRQGDQVQGIASTNTETKQSPHRVLPPLQDLANLSRLICRCMSADPHERPTAKLANEDLMSWDNFEKNTCSSVPQCGQKSCSLLTQIESVRSSSSSKLPHAAEEKSLVYPWRVLNAATTVLSELAMKVQNEKIFLDHDLKATTVLHSLLSLLRVQASSSKRCTL
eukprot:TRINITY_DN47529_c0_g1_i1.p1 TRINITY_DN47529_c0_g1~~TRINITY_DN47529_c0_g1_i1.p1  ORF type:complete len:726 (-),score=54.44 TRINITY_DN47529_c0_g1_i1:139-2316(-)